ncbi:MAG: hypothetical protein ACK4IX_00290 [Candidatus Sericytochromatia bacterium]
MFDKNMLNELSKIKVDRKRKVTNSDSQDINPEKSSENNEDNYYDENDYDGVEYEEEDIEYETISDEENYEEIELPQVSNLQNISSFISENMSAKGANPIKMLSHQTTNDSLSEEEEAKLIRIESRKNSKEYVDIDGNEIKSKYVDDAGNVNVAYSEPGKNIVNRKSVEEQRLDFKMGALSSLLTKFKSDEEIEQEENDPNVIIMDKESAVKKNLKKLDEVINIKNDIEIKISLVKQTFDRISKSISAKSGLPEIEFQINSSDYLRALFLKRSLDDMDLARIFILSLFLEAPEKFPNDDTYEQVNYMVSQVGAKCKSIDLKRLVTYISSDNEFNQTVELVSEIEKRKDLDTSGIVDVFNFKCKETLKTLFIKHLKNESLDPMSRVNVISIKQDLQIKGRTLESSNSMLESLKSKLKATHPSLKEQIKKTNDQIAETEEKITKIKQEISKNESELTIMTLLNLAREKNGYNKDFSNNIPINKMKELLTEYSVNLKSENVDKILNHGIKESMLNEILKNR